MKYRPNLFAAGLRSGLLFSLALAASASATDASYRYFRFTPIKLRGDATSNSIQISEFNFLLAGSPVSLTSATVTNPGGYNSATEPPANVKDGNTATKWLDFSKSPLVFDFGTTTTIDGYRFTTANDATERDPVRWTLEGSADGSAWTVLDSMTSDFATPTARSTATSNISLPASPTPIAKNWTGAASLNWNGSELNWDNGSAVAWDNNSLDTARFSGTGVTISPTDALIVRALDFTQSGYTVQGGSILLTGVTRFTASAPAEISSAIGGSVGIVKNGSSTLTLSGTNTFTGTNSQTGAVLVREGTLVLTGSNAYTTRTSVIGGTLTFSGSGSKTGAGDAIIGNGTGKGILNIGGTSNLSFNGTAAVGDGANGVGAIRMTGGTATFGQDSTYITMGNGTGAYGSFELSGGTVSTATGSGIRVGFNGTGIYTQTGGTVNCNRWFAIAGGSSRGVATFTGGTTNVTSGNRFLLGDAASGNAILNIGTMAGGSATVNNPNSTGVTMLNTATATSAVLNLNNGALVLGGPINRNGTTAGSTATVNLNGGTLRASGSVGLITQSTLMPVNLFNGGVTVDSQANSANISANLLATTGSGIYPTGGVIAVPSNGGSGYYGAPAVVVSGGTGAGATAIANVANGVVTGVTLTSPGQGYLVGDNVTFTFSGGGATTSATPFVYVLTASDIATNGSGGLVKTGTGTLTLSGANTYTGPTSVKNGTLILQLTNATTSVVLGDTSTAGKLQLGNTTAASNLSLSSISTNAGGGSVVGGNPTNSVLTLNVASGTQSITALGGAGTNENNLSLVKNGAGTLAVTGSTSLTGSTSVNAGTLQVSTGSSTTGPCTVSDGASLSVAGSTSSSWRTTNLTLGSSAATTLNILNFNVAATAAPIFATSSLATAGTVTVNVNGLFSPGLYPLIYYPTGGSIGGAGISAFNLGPLPRGVVANIVDDDAGDSVSLNVSAVNALTWKGNENGNWDVNTTANWTLGASVDKFLNNDNIRFDDNASGATSITLNASVTPSNVVFDHTAKNYILTGAGGITGATQLTKMGDGALTLACANTYTGITKVDAGTLNLGDGTSNGSVAGTLINNANLVFNPATTATLPGTLDGAGASLIKTGTGTQILTGANTYFGTIQVNGGTLQIGNGISNGSMGTSSTLYQVGSGAALRFERATAGGPTWASISGSGSVILNSAQAINATALWGSLAVADNFTGVLRVEKGRVDANAGKSALGGTSLIQVLSGAQFLAFTSATPYTTPIEIAGSGWGETGYPDGLRLAGGATATWAGPVTLTADSGIMAQRSSSFTITGAITGAYQCEFYSGDPVGDSGTLTITPGSPVQNSYASTKINGRPNASVIAGNAYAFSSGPLVVDNAILKLNGNNFTFASLSGAGGRIGNFHATAPAVLTVGGAADTSYIGAIQDGSTAKLGLTKTGSGTLSLSGALAYTGDTTVNAGTLSISSSTLNDTATVSIASGAKINLPNAGSDTVGKLVLGGTEVPAGTYNSSHATYGSYFSGDGSLVVVGGYSSWATTMGLDGTAGKENGLADDPEHDGVTNLVEFYLNGNPLASDSSILPASSLDATYLIFTFNRRDDAEADVTSQSFQYGSTLAGWTSVTIGAADSGPDGNGVIVMVSENTTNPDLITVKIPKALAAGGKLFGRLQVVK